MLNLSCQISIIGLLLLLGQVAAIKLCFIHLLLLLAQVVALRLRFIHLRQQLEINSIFYN